jgi:hypothetical protein
MVLSFQNRKRLNLFLRMRPVRKSLSLSGVMRDLKGREQLGRMASVFAVLPVGS